MSTKRCKTNIVQNLPNEILIQIFENIVPINYMRICDEDSCEIERNILRLTCKKWNFIVTNLISHAHIDIYRIKVSWDKSLNYQIDMTL
jgi:hypothetical protein